MILIHSPRVHSNESRKGNFRIRFRFGLSVSVVCGCLGGVQAMQYEPFRFCLETAKVDSSRTWVFVDDGFGAPPPYKEDKYYQYQPDGCLPSETVGKYDYGDMPDIKTFTPRPGGRAVDYTQRFENGLKVTGTEFYSTSGRLDSSFYYEDVVDELDGNFKFTRVQRHVIKPEYELVKSYIAYDDGPLMFSQGDSIVANDSGKTVYSRGDYENRITECVTRAETFICVPTKVEDEEPRLEITWFLNRERPDSMHVALEDGTLYYSRIYFWSPNQVAGFQVRTPAPTDHQSAILPKTYFDLRGRRLGNGQGVRVRPNGLVPGIFPSRE